MTKNVLKSVLLAVVAVALLSFDYPMPENWFKAGSDPASYEMGTDAGAGQGGKNAATIKSIKNRIHGFGTLMQTCLPDKYLGKRVRMSGYLKTKDVAGWAGLWFRIDGQKSNSTLGFDNMKDGKKDRSIKGTTDWAKYEIVLDVPEKATNLAYGALLVKTGQIWFTDISFEVVDNSVPTTGSGSHDEPTNLNFDK